MIRRVCFGCIERQSSARFEQWWHPRLPDCRFTRRKVFSVLFFFNPLIRDFSPPPRFFTNPFPRHHLIAWEMGPAFQSFFPGFPVAFAFWLFFSNPTGTTNQGLLSPLQSPPANDLDLTRQTPLEDEIKNLHYRLMTVQSHSHHTLHQTKPCSSATLFSLFSHRKTTRRSLSSVLSAECEDLIKQVM